LKGLPNSERVMTENRISAIFSHALEYRRIAFCPNMTWLYAGGISCRNSLFRVWKNHPSPKWLF
jgi:hypothetical protein